jgi:transcriptional regulator with XRE-family HTH domain
MSMILQEQFRNLINSELKRLGWTRLRLANEMGVHSGYVSNYLNGDKDPGDDVKEKFFKALGVQPRLTIEPISQPEKILASAS